MTYLTHPQVDQMMTHPPSNTNIDYAALKQALDAADSPAAVYRAVVNAPFVFKLETTCLFLGIIILLLVDAQKDTINRIALSNTQFADDLQRISNRQFNHVVIPLGYKDNLIAQAIRSGEPQGTSDWHHLFQPALTAEEARFDQAGSAISYNAVYPLPGVQRGGALLFSYYQYQENMDIAQHEFMRAYSQLAAQRLHELQGE